MKKFDKIYKQIISESYGPSDDNEFEETFMHHVKEFTEQIEYGEGWINENEVLSQFLSMFGQYRSPLINQSYVEEELLNYLEESGIEVSDRVEWKYFNKTYINKNCKTKIFYYDNLLYKQ